MKINIQAQHFDADAKLVEHIETRLKKLEQFYDRIVFADVFLRLENTGTPENKVVEVLLNVPGDDLIAKKECRYFEVGTDECAQALERQLFKRKAKQRAHL